MKMPTIVGIFIFISRENFMLSWVEHEKSFITSGPDCQWAPCKYIRSLYVTKLYRHCTHLITSYSFKTFSVNFICIRILPWLHWMWYTRPSHHAMEVVHSATIYCPTSWYSCSCQRLKTMILWQLIWGVQEIREHSHNSKWEGVHTWILSYFSIKT